MTLLVDQNFEISLEEFLKENRQPGVTPIPKEDIIAIKSLKIGQSLFPGFGLCEVKRIV